VICAARRPRLSLGRYRTRDQVRRRRLACPLFPCLLSAMVANEPATGALVRVLVIALAVIAGGCDRNAGAGGREASAEAPASAPHYVGGEVCSACHTSEAQRWRGSHHDLAMQPARPDTVLGDFGDTRIEHDGIETRFFTRDGRYLVATEGPDGETGEFEVTHVFGVEPLQQYLIDLGSGRLQALTTAWDSRPRDEG